MLDAVDELSAAMQVAPQHEPNEFEGRGKEEEPRTMRSEFDVAPGAHSTAARGQGGGDGAAGHWPEQYVAAWNEAVAAGLKACSGRLCPNEAAAGSPLARESLPLSLLLSVSPDRISHGCGNHFTLTH
jgi:hypothetical protein